MMTERINDVHFENTQIFGEPLDRPKCKNCGIAALGYCVPLAELRTSIHGKGKLPLEQARLQAKIAAASCPLQEDIEREVLESRGCSVINPTIKSV